ncbi:ABC transporter substrate-binding protein [Sutcliffiella halmapala]|uniref:ABC transporter substrate-binding protein n=1 Tax=Sutcliffiella halmapala TaxID=79882 RepID=UPI0009955DCF|nr:ABC transporter substrate-binding protein [Sutcliffiella halmapala]
MKKILLTIFAILLLITGCSESSSDVENIGKQQGENHYSITDLADQIITFPSVPERIAALSNGDMDIIYALGGELVGRPNSTDEIAIPEAKDVEQIGTTHEIDLEKLTLVRPDVVLGNVQMNSKDVPTIQSLGSQMVLTHAQSVEDIKAQVELFGNMLQKQDKAIEIISTIDQKITDVKNTASKEKVRVLLVYGAPGTYMAALPNSLSGNLLELAGAENIASNFPSLEAYPQYAQMNTERIVEANPQYILLMSHGNPEEVKVGFMKEMEQNAAWNQLDAVKEGRVEVLPSNLFGTNPGTKVIEALDLLVELFQAVNEES